MATLKSSSLSTNGTAAEFTLCTFCNNSTSGFEKRLFASTQPKGPFFPVLAELQGKRTQLDALGRAVVCVACFHHLLRQWSSFERRGIPVRKREYNIITDDRVTSYQTRREEEIRKDADLKIKEIQDREEKIRLEAEERFDSYQKRQAEIRREAETRLLEEQRKLSLEKRDTSLRLKEEQQREDELRRQAEERVQEEKEKREYIRQEAERLLREEKLIEARESKTTESAGSQVVTKFRTEVIIQPPVAKTADKAHRQEIDSLSETHDVDMESFTDEREKQARTERRRKMVYDPETGCYRKTREDDEDKENSSQETKKTERVEYRFRLRSDEKPWKSVEANDPASKPDKESEDITVSMEPMKHSSKEVIVHTEQTFMLNGKRRADSKDDDEMKKSGDVMKTRFEEGRKRFEQEPLERKTSGADYEGTRSGRNGSFGDSSKLRALSDESLEEKIKEMEKRRERLLLRGPSGGNTQERGGEEKPVEDQSPMSESPRDDGARSPVDDTRKKQRNRHERNKRRLTAEELSLRKLSGSDEDLLGLQSTADVVTKVQKTEPKKISSEESSVQLVVRPVGFDKQEEEVFVKTEKPVEASVDLMMWEDSPDGPRTEDTSPVKPTPVPAPRQRAADRSEPRQEKLVEIAPRQRAAERSEPRQEKLVEIAPRQRAAERSEPRQERLVEIEAPISVTKKGSVESAPVQTGFILDLDVKTSTMSSTPAIESISTWDNRGRSSSTIDEERRLREKEHEERKRRIEENQRRAAKEHKAKKQGREEVKLRDKDEEDVRGTDRLSMMEKRRSLVDLWESYSETPARVISLEEQEKPAAGNVKVSNSHGKRPVSIDLAQGDYEVRDMEVDEDDNSRSSMVGFDENHKLSEEERRWESAGHFQPGRLQKTLFHSMSETSPTDEQPNAKPRKGSRYDWMKTENSADQEALVPTKLKLDWSTKQAAIEKPSTVQVTESSPEPALWTNNIENGDRKSSSSSSESDSESEDERKPRVDIDEGHKLTEDEKQWESAGHFQPRKLNTALLAGFQQGPSHEDHKAAPKTQGGPYDMLKKMHNTSSKQEMLVPSKLVVTESETDERAVEEIRPVKVVETETEPGSFTQEGSAEYESDSDDGVPEWRKVEERRRQQEQEEIARAREEERRRQEQKAMEEEAEEDADSNDDEFEAKVRTKEIRRINPNLLVQFMNRSDDKDVRTSKDSEREVRARGDQWVMSPEITPNEDRSPEDSHTHDDDDDEFEQKVKSGQVKKLVLGNSIFHQTRSDTETKVAQKRSAAERSPKESNQDSKVVLIQEEVFVQRVENEVVESQPALSYYDGGEDDHYELKIKGKDVKRLNQDQFGFLRREEEEARRKLQEEERRRLEREERELMKKEEERRRRLQAQAQAEEEERMSLEAELRRQEEEERERRMEEERRRVEEAERLRREEEERLLREEEMERFTWEEMRRQKQEAQKKFQLGLFDGDDAVNRKDKEIASVGRLDSNKLMTFQQTQAEETRVKSKPRQKTKEEPKAPNVESETVVMSSVSLIHSSPYDDVMEESQPEELDYEEKRKSVGRLDTSWYLKQQQMQAADNDRRARELEAERMREEQYEISRMKKGEDTPAADTDYSEKRRGKLSVDKLHQFQQESKESPKRSKETQEQLITIKSRDEVESAPLEFEEFNYKEKRTSKSYDDGNVVILGRDDSEEAQRKVRLQREKDEREMLLKEEERRRELEEQRAALEEIDEEVDDKPKNVGRLNLGKFSLFQQQHQESSQVVSRKQAPPKEKSVQEVVTVQYQEEVESTPTPSDSYQRDVYRGGPSMSPEEVEYEQRVKSGKRLDVQKFLNSRTQEATEREQRKRQMAEERMRQEKEELDKLRSEEQRRRMLLEAEMEYREESRGAVDVSGSRQSEDSRRNRSESAKEKSKEDTDSESSRRAKASRTTQDSEVDNDSKRVSVGRLPQDRRSTFEGSRETEVVASQPRKRSEVSRSQGKGDSTSKYVIQRSGSSSSNKLPYVSRDEDINGNVTHEEKESLEGKSSFGRKESVKEIQYEDHVIESSTQEEKPVPKRLDTSMFAAFQKSESQPAVHLRRVKSEKNARPKSVGNVDLGRWQDDSSLQQSSATRKQREKTDRQPRPKSIAF